MHRHSGSWRDVDGSVGMIGVGAPPSMKECGRQGIGGTEVYVVIHSECGVHTQCSTLATSLMSLALRTACKKSSAMHSYRRKYKNHYNTAHLPAKYVFILCTPSNRHEDQIVLFQFRQMELFYSAEQQGLLYTFIYMKRLNERFDAMRLF